ncbi:MFS transporter [Archaeoglobales archaeon ex4484_92]|nr:MAG: MFS transporter [Archaeoglobales archaeon ex4484_92]HDN74230.1 MFS transporter [Archaeoglobus sp.]
MRKIYLFSISLLPLMTSSGMIYSVLPLYLSKELGAQEMQVGMLFTVGAATGASASIILGKIADKIGRKPLVIFSQSFFALVMLLYSSINSYIYAFPIHVIEGFAWAMIATAAPALVADLAGRNRRGEAIGIYNTTWNLGWVVGPFLGGTLAHLYGFRLTFKLSFLMIAIGTVLTFLLVDERKFLSKT